VAKRRVGRYSNEFRRACVERMKQCDDISALSRELDIDRRLLYRWRDQLDPPDKSEWPPPQTSRESTLRKEVSQLKRVLAEKTLELDFFKGALQKIEARRQQSGAALEQAIATRQPAPGLVHHSDRGLQYASNEYVQVLLAQQIIPSMSRPANPYDNASCESFMKTLKREEIYSNDYVDLEHLRRNIETFIETYYKSLPSAFGAGLSTAGRIRAATRVRHN
jgi:transposase-like protein